MSMILPPAFFPITELPESKLPDGSIQRVNTIRSSLSGLHEKLKTNLQTALAAHRFSVFYALRGQALEIS